MANIWKWFAFGVNSAMQVITKFWSCDFQYQAGPPGHAEKWDREQTVNFGQVSRRKKLNRNKLLQPFFFRLRNTQPSQENERVWCWGRSTRTWEIRAKMTWTTTTVEFFPCHESPATIAALEYGCELTHQQEPCAHMCTTENIYLPNMYS